MPGKMLGKTLGKALGKAPFASGLAALLLAATVGTAAESPGVSPERILFGQSAVFSGEAQELGKNMRLGIEAAFREAGRVHGREVELLSLDDSYEPAVAIVNTRRLIEEEGAFALIGAVGTPTSRSAVPVAVAAKVPYIAPFSGAGFLRDAEELANVVNLRASYFEEAEEMVRRLAEEMGIRRIALFYQNDSFGIAGYRAATRALEKRDMEAVAVTVYPRNTRAVKIGLLEVRNAAADAVIMIGSYQPVAEIIAWSRQIGFDPVFMTLSFVGSNPLAESLGSKGAGVFVTQVVPFPWGDEPSVVRDYRAALRAHAPDAAPGFVSLEGYLAGRLAVTALDRAGPDPTREKFLEALKTMQKVSLGGFPVSFDGDNQGSDSVFLTVIDSSGKYRAVGRSQEMILQ